MEKNKKRILVVDDESPIAEMISEFCQSLGFETKILTSCDNVVEVVKSYRPDLITLDLIMPEPTGLELLEELKGNKQTSSIPVIIISAIAGGESAEELLKLSQGILPKPVKIKALKEKIELALTPAA